MVAQGDWVDFTARLPSRLTFSFFRRIDRHGHASTCCSIRYDFLVM